MVGFRVFDIGGLIAWLIWFHKQTNQDDADDDDDGRGPGDEPTGPRDPPPGLPDFDPWPHRLRERSDRRSPSRPRRPHQPQRDRELV